MDSGWTLNQPRLSLDLTIDRRNPAAVDVPSSVNSLSSSADENFSRKHEVGAIEAKLNQISEENRKLAEMVSSMAMNSGAVDFARFSPHAAAAAKGSANSPKRKKIGDGDDPCKNSIRLRSADPMSSITTSKICVPTNSTLVVDDGYQWRKYGQKVTRDNPFPRAYFRCSFAPSCPVKKKVQRSAEDPSLLVAIYEGEHNHKQPSPLGDGLNHDIQTSRRDVELVKSQRVLVEEMASALTKDPNFTAAIAAAISERIFQYPLA